MFYCPLCENEYIITTSLCEKCGKIKDLIKVYGVNRISDKLNAIYVVKPPAPKTETTDEKNENTKSKK